MSADAAGRRDPARPAHLVVVTGTGTEVGKTFVGAAILAAAVAQGRRVAARKPVQSYDPQALEPLDAEVLAAASGEAPAQVCPPERSYPIAVAPPMAAALLGTAPIVLDDLVAELVWPDDTELGLVEGAGGLRSPLADDGDTRDLIRAIEPDLVVIVADAGLGTIHAVRGTVDSLAPVPATVVLNRWDPASELHRWNRDWIEGRDGLDVVVTIEALLARCVG